MRKGKGMKNLQWEMERRGIKVKDISDVLGCSEEFAIEKMGDYDKWTTRDAFKIRDAFFPTLAMEYLFPCK